jgi:hypothetical protein
MARFDFLQCRTLQKTKTDLLIYSKYMHTFSFLWRCCPTRAMETSFLRFLDHTERRSTVGRTPLDEYSARGRELYLTTHNNHNRKSSMPPAGFEPTIPAGERLQTYASHGPDTGFGLCMPTGKSRVRFSMVSLEFIRDFYRYIINFKKGYQSRTNELRMRTVIWLQTPTVIWLGKRNISLSSSMHMG